MKKIYLTIILVSLFLFTYGQIPSDSLISYWPFNGNANDESGNSLNGTVYGASLTSDRFDNANAAYLFDATDDYIEVDPSSILNSALVNNFSISVWSNSLSPNADRIITIMNKTEDINYDLSINSNNKMQFFNWGGSYLNIESSNEVPIDEWIHTVITIDAINGIAKMYINSGVVGSDDDFTLQTIDNPYVTFGKHTNTSDWVFDGSIDDIRFYDKVLNQEEITILYQENMCSDTIVNDTAIYYVSSIEFEKHSPATYFDSTETLFTNIGSCDSVVNHYSKFIFNSNYYSDTTFVTVYDSISVTDTLIIDAVLTGVDPPKNTNQLKVYPNPAKEYLIINTGEYQKMIDYEIKIVNISGQTVFETKIEEPIYEINLSMWTGEGLYVLQLYDDVGNLINTKKIILQ